MTDTFFGRYKMQAELGRGGMATVYHAYDPRFERDVAIKVLPHEFLHDPQFRARFEREAKTIALLEHPAIVPVYDFGEEDGQPYIVMRYMSGGSLADRLPQGTIPLIEVAQIISRLAPALDAAHKKGIIHRDLKPGNILFDQYGLAYISDFGIARLKQSGGATLTGTAILGTPAYMSPEQVQGDKEIDGRSDIYALGVMLFQMLTGSMPYQADTPAKVMMMHLLEPVPQINQVRSDLPPSFDDITERSLAKNPDERYQTANEMAVAIEDAAYSAEEAPEEGATRIASSPTRISRPPTRPPTRPRTSPPAEKAPEPIPAQKRAGLPIGGIVLALIVLFGIVGIVAVAGFFVLRPLLFAQNTATPMVTTAVALASTNTPLPTSTRPPEPTDTIEPSAHPLPTDTSAPSDTPVPPTETPTPTEAPTLTAAPTTEAAPSIPTIGGGDKLALLDGQNNLWVMNVDGTEMVKLTIDGTLKSNLQWAPDGSGVIYISGNCAKIAYIEAGRVDDIACFDAADPNVLFTFQVSRDGTLVAVTFYNQMYIVPFDLAQLANTRRLGDLKANAICQKIAPYSSNTGTPMGIEWAQWGKGLDSMSVIKQGVEQGKLVDLIEVLDISNCEFGPQRQDEFPATRFQVANYASNPNFENFTWDGEFLFSFVGGTLRNGGFADIYLYNTQSHKGQKLNPVGNGTCCYRDPSWSPDGRYLAFAFQDITLGLNNVTQIYVVQSGTFGTGATYTPIPIPDGFFSNRKDHPQPVLRPAK
jgi:serine/threonine-protein kinase